ncbi:hypothetical protein [Halomonas sp. NO4]|uniref:hypothetical protein n=1 Tax=Halomonas sp. NO4 TaxID=2484813 RepID=UPI0013D34FB1|nr:hypothetical protein [Halomonas sp. NO4]
MAKFASDNVLDNGPAHIQANCERQVLISSYTFGDSYSTVTSNILAEASMASGDFTFSSSGDDRVLTTASGKSDSSANDSGTASHIAFLDDTASEVLWVTEETSGQSITSGNPVNFPQLTYTVTQPT